MTDTTKQHRGERQLRQLEATPKKYGNSSHCITPKEWLGKKIMCTLLEGEKEDDC